MTKNAVLKYFRYLNLIYQYSNITYLINYVVINYVINNNLIDIINKFIILRTEMMIIIIVRNGAHLSYIYNYKIDTFD